MWKRGIFNVLFGFLLLTIPAWGKDLIYTPKVFLDTAQPLRSIKKYDKPTAQFLNTISEVIKEKLIEHLLQKKVILLLENGIGSDITLFYTFPNAKVYKITLYSEEGTRKYYRFGYKFDISVALYIFKSGPNPTLLCYKVYHFRRYFPPSGEYLPVYISFAEPIGESFYLKMVKDIDNVIDKVKEKLEYYKRLGTEEQKNTKGK